MTLLLDLRDQTFADQNRVLSRQELPALALAVGDGVRDDEPSRLKRRVVQA
jgi:hypothetical protein